MTGSSSSKTIKFCKNSTISEAWAIVQGMPSPVTEDSQREVQALIHSGAKKYNDLVNNLKSEKTNLEKVLQ